jgi:hypothetical protein
MTERTAAQVRAEIRAGVKHLAEMRRELRAMLATRRAKAIQMLSEGYTHKQIARATGLRPGGVKEVFRKARLHRQLPPLHALPAPQQRIYYRLRAQRIPALEARAKAAQLAQIDPARSSPR